MKEYRSALIGGFFFILFFSSCESSSPSTESARITGVDTVLQEGLVTVHERGWPPPVDAGMDTTATNSFTLSPRR